MVTTIVLQSATLFLVIQILRAKNNITGLTRWWKALQSKTSSNFTRMLRRPLSERLISSMISWFKIRIPRLILYFGALKNTKYQRIPLYQYRVRLDRKEKLKGKRWYFILCSTIVRCKRPLSWSPHSSQCLKILSLWSFKNLSTMVSCSNYTIWNTDMTPK